MKTTLHGQLNLLTPIINHLWKTFSFPPTKTLYLLHVKIFIILLGSSDGTLQIVDMRVNETKKSQIKIDAHSSDVNVGDWNTIAKHLIITGGDDAMVKVWDLRMCKGKNSEELLCFNWHT